jgi:protein TonB
MFEQTLLPEPENARKPYSIGLSLLIQILVLGALCLAPFVFTQTLPTMHLKAVLAAPPKPPPPVAPKSRQPVVRATGSSPRLFRLNNLPLSIWPADTRPMPGNVAAPPSVEMGDASSGIPFGTLGSAAELPPPAAPVLRARPQAEKRIRVASLSASSLIHMVQPQYPPLAKATRVQGVVEFTATISKQGTIEGLTLKSGHPLLVNAAREAVLQWRYRPTILNGEPVEVITDIIVNFTLSQ